MNYKKQKRKIISFNQFNKNRNKWSLNLYKDKKVSKLSKELYIAADKHNFCYLYNWLGEPMLQTPDDVLTIQRISCKLHQSKKNNRSRYFHTGRFTKKNFFEKKDK